MPTERLRLHGLLDLDYFEFRIGCDLETLGSVFDISIGGVSGKLALPREPEEWPDVVDLHSISLRPPEAEKGPNWRDDLRWGRAYSHVPPRDGRERRASFGLFHLYLCFDIPPGQKIEQVCQTVVADRWRWLYQFCGYYDLLFKHKLNFIESESQLRPKTPMLDLFALEDGKRKQIHFNGPIHFTRVTNKDTSSVSVKDRFYKACQLASEGCAMPLPYQMQLSAYNAFDESDLRKAIIETASATEIALSQTLLKLLENDGITYAKKILKKFQTLGGRAELAKIMGLPGFDKSKCIETLNRPRNKAIHAGANPSRQTTLKAIKFTDELLRVLPDALF